MISEQMIKEIISEVLTQLERSTQPTTEEIAKKIDDIYNINLVDATKLNFYSDEDTDEITAPDYRKRLLVPNPKDEKIYQYMKETTPARIGVWRSGDRPLTETMIRFRADHALAIDAVFSEVDESLIKQMKWLMLKTKVSNKDEHLTRPDLGRELCDESQAILMDKCPRKPVLQIIVSDGLSSKAIEANLVEILPAFIQGLKLSGIEFGFPVFVKYGRVGVMDAIGEDLGAEAAIIFIGERPGLITAESLSAYMIYNPRRDATVAEHMVLSNIHAGGTPPVEAGAHLASIIKSILDAKSSGINFKQQDNATNRKKTILTGQLHAEYGTDE